MWPGLPRVLLIGDSISMGYTLPVRELLEGKANVHRIPTERRSDEERRREHREWLGDGKWDVIHFNWGIHDLKIMEGGQTSGGTGDSTRRTCASLWRG